VCLLWSVNEGERKTHKAVVLISWRRLTYRWAGNKKNENTIFHDGNKQTNKQKRNVKRKSGTENTEKKNWRAKCVCVLHSKQQQKKQEKNELLAKVTV
jgi:hypothetical protein